MLPATIFMDASCKGDRRASFDYPANLLGSSLLGKAKCRQWGKIKVLERTPLAQGKTLYLVKVGRKSFSGEARNEA